MMRWSMTIAYIEIAAIWIGLIFLIYKANKIS